MASAIYHLADLMILQWQGHNIKPYSTEFQEPQGLLKTNTEISTNKTSMY